MPCRSRLNFLDVREYGGFRTDAKMLLPKLAQVGQSQQLDYGIGYRHMVRSSPL